MVPFQRLVFEKHQSEQRENQQGYDLLDDLELDECEGAAIADEAHAVARRVYDNWKAVVMRRPVLAAQ